MLFGNLTRLNEARAARRSAVVVTNLADGKADVVVEGEASHGLDQQIAVALRSGKAMTVEAEGSSWFLNPYLPAPRIVVIGAVHISQVMARIAPAIGYDMTVIDPRTAFATEERFTGVRLLADWPEDVLRSEPLDRYTAVAAVTHDPKIDDFALLAALKAGCFYVGALGSRKTHARRIERLLDMGHAQDEICRISAPIGLDIGASGPPEIALAVMSQIVQAYRHRDLSEHLSR